MSDIVIVILFFLFVVAASVWMLQGIDYLYDKQKTITELQQRHGQTATSNRCNFDGSGE